MVRRPRQPPAHASHISGRPSRAMTRRAGSAERGCSPRQSISSACLQNPYPSRTNRQERDCGSLARTCQRPRPPTVWTSCCRSTPNPCLGHDMTRSEADLPSSGSISAGGGRSRGSNLGGRSRRYYRPLAYVPGPRICAWLQNFGPHSPADRAAEVGAMAMDR